jgi:hypothetical protein
VDNGVKVSLTGGFAEATGPDRVGESFDGTGSAAFPLRGSSSSRRRRRRPSEKDVMVALVDSGGARHGNFR